MMHPGAPPHHMMAGPPHPPPTPMSINMERHIQQTNERLMVIQQQLMQSNGFVAAIKELLDWCSDIRAFQPQYEEGLMGCISTVNRFCASPGFDLQLGFKLLAVCFQHRDRFNPHNGGIIDRCYEDVRNVLLMRNQRVLMNNQGIDLPMASQQGAFAMAQAAQVAAAQAAGMGGVHNGAPPPINSVGIPQWVGPNPTPPPPQHVSSTPHHEIPPTQQSFSLVATVIGNVSAPPTQPISSMTTGSTDVAFTHSNSISTPTHNQSVGVAMGGTGGDHSAAAAAAAAALAAAAATATATATVTALKSDHLQAQPNSQFSSPPLPPPLPPSSSFPPSKAAHNSLPHTPTLSATHAFPPAKGVNPGTGRPATPTAARTPTSVGMMTTPADPSFNQGGVVNPLSPHVQPIKPYPTPPPPPHSQGAWPQASIPSMSSPQSMQYQQYSPHPQSTPPPPRPHPPQQPMQYQQYSSVGGASTYPPSYNARPDNLPLTNNVRNATPTPQHIPFNPVEPFNSVPPPSVPPPSANNSSMMMPGGGGGGGQKRSRYPYPPSQPSPIPSPSPQFPGSGRYPNHYSSQSPAPPQPGTPTMVAPPPYGVPTTPTNDQFYAVPSPVHTMIQPRQYVPSPVGMQSPPSYHPPTPISMATGQPMYPHAPQHTVINSQTLPHQLRLTFAVRDGVLLKPFQLEHGRSLIQVPFHLKESVHDMLLSRNDLELQFKCYHHDDKQEMCNWPQGVSVRVNGHPLNIDRGDSKHLHKPLHLKQVCQSANNYLEITVTACCCSHLFVLQLVHRPSVGSVLQGLLRKRLLPAEHCVAKIKRWFQCNNDDSIQQTGVLVSLKCPITFKKIQLPARGADCKHIQCFDLQSYLQLNCDRGTWRCPVCNNSAQLEGLEVDQYIWGILSGVNNNKMEVEEITIDPSANWKAHSKEPDEEDGPMSKKMKNEGPTTPQTPTSIKKPHSNPPPQPSSSIKQDLPPPPHLVSAVNGGGASLPPPPPPPSLPLPLPPGVNGSNTSLINNQQQFDENLDNLNEILDNIGDTHFFDNLSSSADPAHSNELLSILES